MTDRRLVLALIGAGAALGVPGVAMASAASPRDLAREFAATLSAHDIDGFAALFAEDYINHQNSAAAPPPAAGVTPVKATVVARGAVASTAARPSVLPSVTVVTGAWCSAVVPVSWVVSDRVSMSWIARPRCAPWNVKR